MGESKTSNLAQRAAILSLAATTVVVAIKLTAALKSGSVSVLSEALQSIMDIAMSGLAVFSVRYAARPPDRDHPYGHGKAELLSAAIQMVVIVLTSTYIAYRAWERYLIPEAISWDIGAMAMAASVAINITVAAHLGRVSKQTGSASLASEALHLRGDTVMSGGVLVGMLLVGFTGILRLDPIAAALSAAVGIYSAVRQLGKLIHPLMDGSLPEVELTKLEVVLTHHPEVRGYHNLRTRAVGANRFIDLHVMLDDTLTFIAAHDSAERIEDELRLVLGGAIVNIHYEPFEVESEHRRTHHSDKPIG
jgi:cation diffusion facilitator family transporter